VTTEATYRAVAASARGLFGLLGLRLDVRGAEHLPATGGAVLAANHIGYLDFALLGYLGRQRGRFVRILAKSGVFELPVLGLAMDAARHVPVDREQGAGAVLRARRLLDQGEVVGLFPEATISRSFLVKPLAPGAAALAIACQVPLVPVVTFGGHRVLTVDGRWSHRRGTPVLVRVGEPLSPATGADPHAVAGELRAGLSAMLEEAIRDYPRQGADGAWWLPESWGGSAPDPELAARLDAEALARSAARRALDQYVSDD
jgi:1-acyl-sn-glycerol-3-phosphate acyltransferase